MAIHQGVVLCLGVLMMTAGGAIILALGLPDQWVPGLLLGLFLCLGGMGFVVNGLCMAMKNLQVTVPGHFLLHPRTGTRFSPQQALAIQRRLDRIRREMSTDSISRAPDPEWPLRSSPPPWTMEPPPSYDTVVKIQEQSEQH